MKIQKTKLESQEPCVHPAGLYRMVITAEFIALDEWVCNSIGQGVAERLNDMSVIVEGIVTAEVFGAVVPEQG